MDRTTANKLALLAGYRDVEHLLLEAGVLAEMEEIPGGSAWRDRDIAVKIAARMGYSDEVIAAVVARHREHEYSGKNMLWWNDRIVIENMQRMAEQAAVQGDAATRTALSPTPLPASRFRSRKRGTGTEG